MWYYFCVQSWHGHTILANVLHISIGMHACAYVWTCILVIYYHGIVDTVKYTMWLRTIYAGGIHKCWCLLVCAFSRWSLVHLLLGTTAAPICTLPLLHDACGTSIENIHSSIHRIHTHISFVLMRMVHTSFLPLDLRILFPVWSR